ncbi:MAG TPA: hypothetical protein VHO48_11485, partial [Anaerolineaceae bacterium]|nr:hypothetical protein [Anaerolineaceae bacterium]
IRKVDPENARDRRAFSALPFQLYRNCPNWVPPLASEMADVFDRRRHPFYRHSQADFFLAQQDGQVVGRTAVLHNRRFCDYHQEATAFFYYFDCIDDETVASALFAAAGDWARARSLTSLLGPKGFLRSSGAGLLVDGFEYPPALGIPYNYNYYEKLLLSTGFKKESDFLSGFLNKSQSLSARIHEIAEKVTQKGSFTVRCFHTRAEVRSWYRRLQTAHDQAFQNNPNFYPMTDEEANWSGETFLKVIDPRLIKLIMKGDQIAGFIFAYRDISRALQCTGGKLWPFGWIAILLEMNRSKVVNLNGMGFLPSFQGLGANALLYTEVEKTLQEVDFDLADLVQIDERNTKSIADMENIGIRWSKRHRTYRKAII